jgi:hypothetical protein
MLESLLTALEARGFVTATAMPASAELFLGFTSTQSSAMALGRVPSFETLPGFTNRCPAAGAPLLPPRRAPVSESALPLSSPR